MAEAMDVSWRCPKCKEPLAIEQDPRVWAVSWNDPQAPFITCRKCGSPIMFTSKMPDPFDWSLPDEE